MICLISVGACVNSFAQKSTKKTVNKKMNTITKTTFGQLPDGQTADLFTLRSAAGVEVRISNYGGIISHLLVPDKNGVKEDVVLGYDHLDGYLKASPYFGALIGRYGNRIADAKFTLEGKEYPLAVNSGVNNIHGGKKGFDKKVWKAEVIEAENALKLSYVSPDGEEGFPGTLSTEVTYRLTDDNALEIEYRSTTDKTTIVNLTNHTYFNFTGAKTDVLDHVVTINADYLVPVNKNLIPTGELRAVKGTPFDFLQPHVVGERINDPEDDQIKVAGGYDHCWVVNGEPKTLRPTATAYEPTSGRFMEVFTTEPGIQFYTGNFLSNNITGKNDITYRKRIGFCFETQHYPDSPNQPQFPSVVLRPGEEYYTKTVYKFSVK